jgi:putative SOS response-associated peptidase YedK
MTEVLSSWQSFAGMIENDDGIKRNGNTVQNPQANAILEQVHQTIEYIIQTCSKVTWMKKILR